MRHFTQVAEPVGGWSPSQLEIIDVSHLRSESAFKKEFGRHPDHTDPPDADESWRLFLEELEIVAASLESVGEDGQNEAEETRALIDHYQAAWEKAQEDSGFAFG
jgi:hypothetical protein